MVSGLSSWQLRHFSIKLKLSRKGDDDLKKLILISMLTFFTPAHAGIISSIGKAAVEGAETIGEKVFKKSDDAANNLPNSSNESELIIKRIEDDEPTSKSFSEALDAARQANSDGSIQFLDRAPLSLTDSFGDRGFNNFWTWWVGLKTTKALAQNIEQKLERDQAKVQESEDFHEEVKIRDPKGNLTFNYLINPIMEESRSNEDDEIYMSGMSDMVGLLTVSGRVAGFDPLGAIDFERVRSSSTIDFLYFDANLLAAAVLREDEEAAKFFSEHLEGITNEVFSSQGFTAELEKIIGCIGMLYSADGFQYGVMPGSSSFFEDNCSSEQMFKMASEFKTSAKQAALNLQNQSSELEPKQQQELEERLKISNLTAETMVAVVASLYQEHELFFKSRNRALQMIRMDSIPSEAAGLALTMLSGAEFEIGNSQTAFQMAKMGMALGQKEPTTIQQSSLVMASILIKEGSLQKAEELIEIMRVMAYPKSEFFVPVDSKIALAQALLHFEYHLSRLDGV
jgi:hypothetical protein